MQHNAVPAPGCPALLARSIALLKDELVTDEWTSILRMMHEDSFVNDDDVRTLLRNTTNQQQTHENDDEEGNQPTSA